MREIQWVILHKNIRKKTLHWKKAVGGKRGLDLRKLNKDLSFSSICLLKLAKQGLCRREEAAGSAVEEFHCCWACMNKWWPWTQRECGILHNTAVSILPVISAMPCSASLFIMYSSSLIHCKSLVIFIEQTLRYALSQLGCG